MRHPHDVQLSLVIENTKKNIFYKSILKQKKDNGRFDIRCTVMLSLKSLEKTKIA